MTDQITAQFAGAQQFGTSTMKMQDLPSPPEGGFVAEFGSDLLNSVERMRDSYAAGAEKMAGSMATSEPGMTTAQTVHPGPAAQQMEGMEQLARLTENMQHSAHMQVQLAEFVMLSSVTSAFGRNLNNFLRGQ